MTWRRAALALALAVVAVAAVVGGSSISADPSAVQTALWPRPPMPRPHITEMHPPGGSVVDRVPAPIREHGLGVGRDIVEHAGDLFGQGVQNAPGDSPDTPYQNTCWDRYDQRYYYC